MHRGLTDGLLVNPPGSHHKSLTGINSFACTVHWRQASIACSWLLLSMLSNLFSGPSYAVDEVIFEGAIRIDGIRQLKGYRVSCVLVDCPPRPDGRTIDNAELRSGRCEGYSTAGSIRGATQVILRPTPDSPLIKSYLEHWSVVVRDYDHGSIAVRQAKSANCQAQIDYWRPVTITGGRSAFGTGSLWGRALDRSPNDLYGIGAFRTYTESDIKTFRLFWFTGFTVRDLIDKAKKPATKTKRTDARTVLHVPEFLIYAVPR